MTERTYHEDHASQTAPRGIPDPLTRESPDHVRTSIAAAMTLGFMGGRFHRNATSPCVNLLLTYDSGCAGRCGYCGLSMGGDRGFRDRSFIRVGWPTYPMDRIIEGIRAHPDKVKRVCISMITNIRSMEDTILLTRRLREEIEQPVALLVAPTILTRDHLVRFREAGADKIGVAVDCARPDLFEAIRGRGVNGPHQWERYWQCLTDAIDVFGPMNVGAHLITGLGETERDMVEVILRVHDLGGWTHLFSFFPEQGSALADRPQPSVGQYRRIQLARWLIDGNLADPVRFRYDADGRIVDFGITTDRLLGIIRTGRPFMTSGCPGRDGEVACNRPYANCVPGPDIRNYPFLPDHEDVARILDELGRYG